MVQRSLKNFEDSIVDFETDLKLPITCVMFSFE